MQLSIVTTVFRTAQFLENFAERTTAAAHDCGLDNHEIIVVVDGSPDDAVPVLRRLKQRFPRIRVIELSRNFGHHPALWCGLEHARGNLVFLIDSDCETPPEVLTRLHQSLLESEADVAYACRRARTESWFQRTAARIFWGVFGMLAEVRVPRGILTERLMRRPYVEALLSLEERTLFLGGMMEWIGFRQTAVQVDRTPRRGRPSYSWSRRAALAFDAITSFSIVPMRALFAGGTALASVALLAAFVLAMVKLARPATLLSGFTAIFVMLLFSLGVIVAAIGLVGLYLGKVFVETKGRPLYIVREEF